MDIGDELGPSAIDPEDLPQHIRANSVALGSGDEESPNGESSGKPFERAPFVDEEPIDLAHQTLIESAGVILVKVSKEMMIRWQMEMRQGPVETKNPDGSMSYVPRSLGKLRIYDPAPGSTELTWELRLPPCAMDPLPVPPPQPIASTSRSDPPPPPPIVPSDPLDLSDPAVRASLVSHRLEDFENSVFDPAVHGPEHGPVWKDKIGNLAKRRYLMTEKVRRLRPNGRSTGYSEPKIIGNATKVARFVTKEDPVQRKRDLELRYAANEASKTKIKRLDQQGLSQKQFNQLMSGNNAPRMESYGKDEGPATASRPTGATKIVKDKAVRLDHATLLDLLFECFAEYQYWATTALVHRLGQPKAHLTRALGGIALQDKSGPYKDLWHLKDNFIGHQGEAEVLAEAPEQIEMSASAAAATDRVKRGGGVKEEVDAEEEELRMLEDDDDEDEEMEEVE